LGGGDKILDSSQLGVVNRHYDGIIERAISKNYSVWLMTDSKNISTALIKKTRPRDPLSGFYAHQHRCWRHVGVETPQDRQRLCEGGVPDVLVGMTCAGLLAMVPQTRLVLLIV
jgi:hypothetical protein